MTGFNSIPNKPIVAIVGRPNVGKSTLFNRLNGTKNAIVSDKSGTTRDRLIAETTWVSKKFVIVDTGGLDLHSVEPVWDQVLLQIESALEQCDVVTFLVDTNDGITALDRDVAEILRVTDKPIVLAANKSDNDTRRSYASEFYELGFGDPIPISAYHNYGVEDLMDLVLSKMPDTSNVQEHEQGMRLAIVGRANVGKSMLLNSVVGEQRSIVSSLAGTTRDSIDVTIEHEENTITLIDTAGIRKRGKIERGIEQYSVLRSTRAIERSHVAALIIDASDYSTAQDTHIANYALESFKAIVIVVNKWDLSKTTGFTKQEVLSDIRKRFKFASFAPICFTSAINKTGIKTMLNTAVGIYNEWSKSIPRADVRKTILSAVAEHPPTLKGKRELKIYSAVQDGAMPPSFTFFVNHADMIHFSYRRYLENKIREDYNFEGCPLRMRFRGWHR